METTTTKYKLFEHQAKGLEFLIEKRKAILADEMGLGKTRQAAAAALELTNGGIIICPASLKTNWAREIIALDGEARIDIAGGNSITNYSSGKDGHSSWVIANYDVIDRPNVVAAMAEQLPTTMILDEAHYIKSTKAKRSKQAIKLTELATNVFLLTGTPIMNRPMELFNLLKAIDHPLAENWYSFAFKYCGAFKQEFWRHARDPKTGKLEKRKYSFLNTDGATNLDDLRVKVASAYLRRTKDILGKSLPAKIITNVEIDLDEATRYRYKNAWNDYITYLQNHPIDDAEAEEKDLVNILLAQHLVEIQKLKQVASQAKVPTIIDDALNMAEQDEKVIIFTQYTETLQQIAKGLREKKVGTVTVSGSDNANSRQAAVDGFQQDPNIKVFVGNIKAAGVGITLTAASTVLFADMDWTPALHQQAEDRAHRIGQHKQVNIYYYIARDTIDEDIVELLDKKNQVIKEILEGDGKRINNTNVATQLIKKLSTR